MLLLLSVWMTEAAVAQTHATSSASVEAQLVAKEVGKSDPNLENYRGHALRVRQNDNGELISIGYRLFDDAMMGADSLELDFIERYFLMLDATTPAAERKQRLKDDKVNILKGTESDIFRFADSGIEKGTKRVDGKPQVSIKARNGEGDVFSIIEYPVSFELMTRQTRSELENNLPIRVKSQSKMVLSAWSPDLEGIEPDSEGRFVNGGLSYYLESLTDQTYFEALPGEVKAIFKDEDRQRSAANLMLGAVNEERRLELIQKLYGFNEQRISTSVGQWLNYCRENGMKLYFAVEKEAEDGILGLVIAVNGKLMYNHLLSVLIPHDFVTNPSSVLKGTLTAYIPTHNLDELYEQRAVFKKKDLSKIKNAE